MVSQPLRCLRLWLEGQRHIGSRAKVGMNTPHCVGHGSVGSQGVFRLFLVPSARSHIGSHWHLERICSDCCADVWGFNAWSWATQAALQLCNSRFLLWQSCLDDLSFGHWVAWEATHKVTVFLAKVPGMFLYVSVGNNTWLRAGPLWIYLVDPGGTKYYMGSPWIPHLALQIFRELLRWRLPPPIFEQRQGVAVGTSAAEGQKFQGLRSSKPWEILGVRKKRIRSRKFGILVPNVPKFEQEIKRKNQLLQALESLLPNLWWTRWDPSVPCPALAQTRHRAVGIQVQNLKYALVISAYLLTFNLPTQAIQGGNGTWLVYQWFSYWNLWFSGGYTICLSIYPSVSTFLDV